MCAVAEPFLGNDRLIVEDVFDAVANESDNCNDDLVPVGIVHAPKHDMRRKVARFNIRDQFIKVAWRFGPRTLEARTAERSKYQRRPAIAGVECLNGVS